MDCRKGPSDSAAVRVLGSERGWRGSLGSILRRQMVRLPPPLSRRLVLTSPIVYPQKNCKRTGKGIRCRSTPRTKSPALPHLFTSTPLLALLREIPMIRQPPLRIPPLKQLRQLLPRTLLGIRTCASSAPSHHTEETRAHHGIHSAYRSCRTSRAGFRGGAIGLCTRGLGR